MTTSARTSAISSMPTTTRTVSRHSLASRLTNTFAKYGHPSQIDHPKSDPPHAGTEHLAFAALSGH